MKKLSFSDFYTIVWSLVPAVWKEADDEYGKSLQILLYTMSQHMYYYFYNRVVHMEELFDPDRCPEKYLKFLAGMVGWKLMGSDPDSWREQIKAAPLLYKIRGTKRGVLLAEKLIGYSIFMSELYRDHIGDAVPKERIFNNTPASIKQKPWFRTNLNSLEGELLGGHAESDQFDSFNLTPFVKLDKLGSVIRPRVLTNTRKLIFTPSSTNELYNNLTGKYSIARYAKIPRMNVVLKHDHDLGEENADGSIKQHNFTGALDLLLQFKPFHVYIENLEVRYSLSEYVFCPGEPNEVLNIHETVNTAVNFNMTRAENTIGFRSDLSEAPVLNTNSTIVEVPDAVDNLGVISSVFKSFDLSILEYIINPSLDQASNKTLTVKSFVPVSGTPIKLSAFRNTIFTQDDFQGIDPYYPTTNGYAVAPAFSNELGGIVYNPGHAVVKFNMAKALCQQCPLDFRAMLSSQFNKTQFTDVIVPNDLLQPNKIISNAYRVGLDNTCILGINISSDPYRSSVQTNQTTFIKPDETTPTVVDGTQSITSVPSRPWDLRDLGKFADQCLPSMPQLDIFKSVYDNLFVLVLEVSGDKVLLTTGTDYYIDMEQNIHLNSAAISSKLTVPETEYNFILTSTLHVLYLTRTTYANITTPEVQVRGFRYKTRNISNYSRQFSVNSLPQETLTGLMPTELVSVNPKTKIKTVLGVKSFKTKTNIYNRSSLKNEVIDNYSVVSKNPLNRIDSSKWVVYSPEKTLYYLGDQKITNNWWGNYYQAKFPDSSPGTPAMVPYDLIDRSSEAQLQNVASNQWQSALKVLNLSDPSQFLVTRTTSPLRTGIWKRNSCKFVSVPFIRSRRDTLQVFRRDAPTFTRTEESTDYLIDTGAPFRLDNYKYVLPDGTDVSYSYFDAGFSETASVNVTMDRTTGQKAVLSQTGYGITYPSSDTYYNNFVSDINPESYFSIDSHNEYVVKSSLYAGNIPVSRDLSSFTGITEGLDKLDISISGLITVQDNFTVAPGENKFFLSKSALAVNWIERSTSEVVSFGYHAPAGVVVSPNIIVILNGVAVTYGNSWTMSFGRMKELILLDPLNEGDTISVEYQTFPGPDRLLVAPPSPQVPHTLSKTIDLSDTSFIKQGNRLLISLPISGAIPGVSWYSNKTSQFISYGDVPIQYQPMALFQEAEPNVEISVNGTKIKYKKDWLFLLKTSGDTVIACVAISPEYSMTLSVNDIIQIDYFSTT